MLNSCAECVYDRDAVVAVDRYAGKESDEFQPQKRTKLYGIATAYAQCPSGKHASCEGETGPLKCLLFITFVEFFFIFLAICESFRAWSLLCVAPSTDVQHH